MDGLTLLHKARAAGLEVKTDGAKLIIRGPKKAEAVALELLAHKSAVLAALTIPQDHLPAEWHLLWDERAAIMEYDAGLPRERAEAAALKDILHQMQPPGVFPGPTKP